MSNSQKIIVSKTDEFQNTAYYIISCFEFWEIVKLQAPNPISQWSPEKGVVDRGRLKCHGTFRL